MMFIAWQAVLILPIQVLRSLCTMIVIIVWQDYMLFFQPEIFLCAHFLLLLSCLQPCSL